MNLDSNSFKKAKGFISRHARPLEQKIFHYHFDNGTTGEIFDELIACQNGDGGFANSQEPDFRSELSSVLSSSHALRIFRDYGISKDADTVKRAIRYLLETFDDTKRVWKLIPAGADGTPHAPWWDYEGIEERFEHFLSNPRPEIVGYLWDYPSLTPEDFREGILDDVMNHFKTLPDGISGDSLSCYLSLYESDAVRGNDRKVMKEKLEGMIDATIEKNPDKWTSYCFKPLWAIPSPDSDFYPIFEDIVSKNLDYEIEHQAADGGWEPFWNWGNHFPETWEQAKVEWKGILTVKTVVSLRDFGRLAGS